MRSELFLNREWNKTAQAWWYAVHGEPINERLLSKLGVAVIDASEEPLAFAFIYPCPAANFAMLGWTVRNPFVSSFRAGKALKLLIEAAETEVRQLGYPLLYTAYDSPALQRLVSERGYFPGSLVQEYFKEL